MGMVYYMKSLKARFNFACAKYALGYPYTQFLIKIPIFYSEFIFWVFLL